MQPLSKGFRQTLKNLKNWNSWTQLEASGKPSINVHRLLTKLGPENRGEGKGQFLSPVSRILAGEICKVYSF
jgi:hypothetical protein